MNEPTNYVLSHLNNYENYVMFHLNLCLSFRMEKKNCFSFCAIILKLQSFCYWYRFSPVCFWVLQKFSRSHFTLKYRFLFQYLSLNQLRDKEAMRTHKERTDNVTLLGSISFPCFHPKQERIMMGDLLLQTTQATV